MAKRTSAPPPAAPANLTPDQMRSAINKLERRIAELKAFDVASLTSGSDPAMLALEASIQQTLEAAYGPGTTDFNRYSSAFDLDTTSYRMAFYVGPGGSSRGTSVQEIREGVK